MEVPASLGSAAVTGTVTATEAEVSLVAYHTRRCVHRQVGFYVECTECDVWGSHHSGEYFVLADVGVGLETPRLLVR